MDLKCFGVLCFISILSNCSMEVYGSSLKCCFKILSNHSVTYHLNEPPGGNCTRTWSEDEYVVVDEHGNVDEKKVVYVEAQMLVLKENTNEKDKEVIYRKDCLPHTYTAKCHDPCVALEPLRTTSATETTGVDHGITYIIVGVVVVIIIIIIIIIIILIFIVICHRRKCQTSKVTLRYIWKAVPKIESPTALVSDDSSNKTFIEENTE